MRIKTFVITKGVHDYQLENKEFHKAVYDCLHSFQCYNWGECCESDIEMNDQALETGDMILGNYDVPSSPENKLWVIADPADQDGKRVVTVLFPSEY
jgi:hypothetical protein